MRAVVQRVGRASVSVNAVLTGSIGKGLLVLLGVGHDDTQSDAEYLAGKIAGLREIAGARAYRRRPGVARLGAEDQTDPDR